MQGEQALFNWFRCRLGRGVETRMRDIHEHLRRRESDDPAPQLPAQPEVSWPPKGNRLSDTFVRLTVDTRALQMVHTKVPFQLESQSEDLEFWQAEFPGEWLLEFECENQMAIVRDACTDSVLVATRVASSPALINVLEGLLTANGRPARILHKSLRAIDLSLVRVWGRFHGIRLVSTQRHRAQRLKASWERLSGSSKSLRDPATGLVAGQALGKKPVARDTGSREREEQKHA